MSFAKKSAQKNSLKSAKKDAKKGVFYRERHFIIVLAVLSLVALIGACQRRQAAESNLPSDVPEIQGERVQYDGGGDGQASEVEPSEIVETGGSAADEFAPQPNLSMTFDFHDQFGERTKEFYTVKLNGMATGYLCTIYSVDSPAEYVHYYSEKDGLSVSGVFDDLGQVAGILLPASMVPGITWEQSRLMRIEGGENSFGLNEDTECAYVLEVGPDLDITYVYGKSLGLVAVWNNAGCSGKPFISLKNCENISQEAAEKGFEGTK